MSFSSPMRSISSDPISFRRPYSSSCGSTSVTGGGGAGGGVAGATGGGAGASGGGAVVFRPQPVMARAAAIPRATASCFILGLLFLGVGIVVVAHRLLEVADAL